MAARELDTNRLELARAIEDCHPPRVRSLLARGVIDLAEPLNGKTFLMMAIESGPPVMVQDLLDAGADPNQPNGYGVTPMHTCAKLGIPSNIPPLVMAGAELNPQDVSGDTPLHAATRCRRDACAKILLDLGADSGLTNDEGKTPDALCNEKQQELRQILRENQSPPLVDMKGEFTADDLLRRNGDDVCALDAGVTWMHAERVIAVLEAQGRGLTRDALLREGKQGKTYLQRAVENGAGYGVLEHLLDHGERLQPQDFIHDGQPTPLLESAIDRGMVDAFFSHRMWEGRSAEELTAAFRAMPPEGQGQVKNYFNLCTRLRKEQAVSQPEHRGR